MIHDLYRLSFCQGPRVQDHRFLSVTYPFVYMFVLCMSNPIDGFLLYFPLLSSSAHPFDGIYLPVSSSVRLPLSPKLLPSFLARTINFSTVFLHVPSPLCVDRVPGSPSFPTLQLRVTSSLVTPTSVTCYYFSVLFQLSFSTRSRLGCHGLSGSNFTTQNKSYTTLKYLPKLSFFHRTKLKMF